MPTARCTSPKRVAETASRSRDHFKPTRLAADDHLMNRLRTIWRILAVATATVLFGSSMTHAVPAEDDLPTLDVLTEALESLRSGDIDRYELVEAEITTGDFWLPTMARTALADRDEDRLVLVWLALETDDVGLILLAMDTIAAERDAVLFGTVGDPESGFNVRRADEDNVAMRQILGRRGIAVPPTVEKVMALNQPGEGRRPPRPALFDDAIAEFAAIVASMDVADGAAQGQPTPDAGSDFDALSGPRDGDGGTASDRDAGGLSAMAILLLVFGVVGLGSLSWTLLRTRRHDEMADLAFTDSLTGLNNRRRFDTDVDALGKEGDQPTAMLMIDVDHFKSFNDTYGHSVGDQVLQLVAGSLSKNVRRHDIAYRYGGEEFCVLLPEANEQDALATGERLRSAVHDIELPVPGTISVSVGVSIGPAVELDDTIERADAALFTAKDSGRNCVVLG